MDLQEALTIKYHKNIPLSDLDGKTLELDTTTCGIVIGSYLYGPPHFSNTDKKIVDTDIITLKNISSNVLAKVYPTDELLKKAIMSFTPEQVKDITIHF